MFNLLTVIVELDADWASHALSFLECYEGVAAVSGRLRERHPEKSIYNWLCDQEWNSPVGEVHAFAGNVIIRSHALNLYRGFRDDVIAAEEDELCVRLRAANWRIWKLGSEMALHDAAMNHFGQWWKRCLRCGYAFAQGAYLHGEKPERHFVWESRRARIWGLYLPLLCIWAGVIFQPVGWITFLIFPLQVLRLVLRGQGSLIDRAIVSAFQEYSAGSLKASAK